NEELIAEMTAAFLAGEAGIDVNYPQHAGYIASWLRKLQNDPKLVVQAAGAAQRAANLILGTDATDSGSADEEKEKELVADGPPPVAGSQEARTPYVPRSSRSGRRTAATRTRPRSGISSRPASARSRRRSLSGTRRSRGSVISREGTHEHRVRDLQLPRQQ